MREVYRFLRVKIGPFGEVFNGFFGLFADFISEQTDYIVFLTTIYIFLEQKILIKKDGKYYLTQTKANPLESDIYRYIKGNNE